MSGTAGYSYTISVCATVDGTYQEIKSQNGTFNRTADVLDDTDTTNAGYHTRLLGLLDSACSVEAHWAASDSALSIIETAYENRSACFVKVLPDGQAGNGKRFPVVIENYNTSLDVTGLATVSISFQGNGAVTADNA
tara:strand:+ start:352 stop:762 length:411 start_codon:yes stop_codon:yes gene_type:complete